MTDMSAVNCQEGSSLPSAATPSSELSQLHTLASVVSRRVLQRRYTCCTSSLLSRSASPCDTPTDTDMLHHAEFVQHGRAPSWCSAALLALCSRDVQMLVLQAGLAALKVPQSLEEGTNKEDPLHLDDFRHLASALPFSKHVHSKLVCAITRAPMKEHNPPMVRCLCRSPVCLARAVVA